MGMKTLSGKKATRTLESMEKTELINFTFFITENGYAAQIQVGDEFSMILSHLENRNEIKEKLRISSEFFTKQLEDIVDKFIKQATDEMEKDIENRKKSVS